jgi:hypothetical protein
METVSSEARRMLAASGRYLLIDVTKADAEPVRARAMRNCEGCEAGIADQALIGVVRRRITQTDYYIVIQITDAQTGKVLDQQATNLAGGTDGWVSGVRNQLESVNFEQVCDGHDHDGAQPASARSRDPHRDALPGRDYAVSNCSRKPPICRSRSTR